MFRNRELVRKAVNRVSRAAKETLRDLEEGRVRQEPSFTDRLITNIQSELNGRTIAGVTWSAVTLGDRGPKSPESEIGADFLAVVRFNLQQFTVSKGFLAQAKLIEPAGSFPTAESARLKSQCERMLQITPDSYVFLYSLQSGILVVPATAVLAARECNPHELTTKSIRQFYTDHFECFVGDRRLSAATGQDLDKHLAEYRARRALLLIGQEKLHP